MTNCRAKSEFVITKSYNQITGLLTCGFKHRGLIINLQDTGWSSLYKMRVYLCTDLHSNTNLIDLGVGESFDVSSYIGYGNLTADNFIISPIDIPEWKHGSDHLQADYHYGSGGSLKITKTYDSSTGILTAYMRMYTFKTINNSKSDEGSKKSNVHCYLKPDPYFSDLVSSGNLLMVSRFGGNTFSDSEVATATVNQNVKIRWRRSREGYDYQVPYGKISYVLNGEEVTLAAKSNSSDDGGTNEQTIQLSAGDTLLLRAYSHRGDASMTSYSSVSCYVF